jgi:hypothetical protein
VYLQVVETIRVPLLDNLIVANFDDLIPKWNEGYVVFNDDWELCLRVDLGV